MDSFLYQPAINESSNCATQTIFLLDTTELRILTTFDNFISTTLFTKLNSQDKQLLASVPRSDPVTRKTASQESHDQRMKSCDVVVFNNR